MYQKVSEEIIDKNSSYTKKYQSHISIPCSFGYRVICIDKLFDLVDEKVRDHCHISGEYRGAAHLNCNTNLKISKKVPVIFHNLRGYDSHLIIQKIK